MDYKKAYEDALERAKGIYNENPSSSTAKFVCGQIFPEITLEERITGCIEMVLTDASEHRFEDFGVSLKDCLSWLERRKESDCEWTEYDDEMVKNMCEEGDLKPSERGWLKKLKNRIVKKVQQPAE